MSRTSANNRLQTDLYLLSSEDQGVSLSLNPSTSATPSPPKTESAWRQWDIDNDTNHAARHSQGTPLEPGPWHEKKISRLRPADYRVKRKWGSEVHIAVVRSSNVYHISVENVYTMVINIIQWVYLSLTWMSSLKVQYFSRYFLRKRKALWLPKSSNWISTSFPKLSTEI